MNAEQSDERAAIRAAMSDPLAVCNWLGIAEGHKRQARGISIHCPKHSPDKSQSCSVTRGEGGGLAVKCFTGCNFGGEKGGGDELHLIAAVRGYDIRRDFPVVLQLAADFAGVTLSDAPREVRRPAPILRTVPVAAPLAADLSAEWAALPPLDSAGWDYLVGRGLASAVDWCRSVPAGGLPVRGSLLGLTGDRADELVPWGRGLSIALAMRDAAGRIVAIQGRNLLGGDKHDFRVLGQSQAGLFGQVEAVKGALTVVICEGLTDTLAALVGLRDAISTAVVGIAGTNNREAIFTLPLAGKRVLVAMDADGATPDDKPGVIKGDEAAKIIADGVTAIGGKPVRLRPEGGKDLAEMLAAGVDLLAFARGAFRRAAGFQSFEQRTKVERAVRLADRSFHVEIGIPFLAAAFRALIRSDVLLLGAETGIGKTEAATIMAMKAAEAGKRVHYFALEATEGEIEQRIKYKLLSSLIYSSGHPERHRLNYVDWRLGLIDDITGPLEPAADVILGKKYRTLYTFYRTACQSFTAGDLKRVSTSLSGESDLNVIDHFHFIDDDGETNENRAAKRLARTISDVASSSGVPAILVAHLKKLDTQKNAPIVPRITDFHGSSDLGKIVTKAVIFAPAHDQPQEHPWLLPTYARIAKFRLEGARTRYCGLMNFNIRKTDYEEGFNVGKLIEGDRKFAFVDDDKLPPWARQ